MDGSGEVSGAPELLAEGMAVGVAVAVAPGAGLAPVSMPSFIPAGRPPGLSAFNTSTVV